MLNILEAHVQSKWTSDKKRWKNIEEYLLFLKQKKAYCFVSSYCNRKNILEYGCGSGYGAKLLAENAANITAVDMNKDVVKYCQKEYSSKNLSFEIVNPRKELPFKEKVFDIITSFQVIEHVQDVNSYLSEFYRILKDDGILFVTTPNRKYRVLPFKKPWNLEHIREYYKKDFKKELLKVFPKVEILGIYGTDEINQIEYNRVKQRPFMAYIFGPAKKYLQAPIEEVLKSILPASVEAYFKSLRQQRACTVNQTKPLDVNLLNQYSLDNFSVGRNFKKSLDFIALCKKY